MTKGTFPQAYFRRQDERKDSTFYSIPRKVVHIDQHAIRAIGQHYRDLLPSAASILDLMSSWRSHIPEDIAPARVVGLGMNAAEMADNPQLNAYHVHDLNQDPNLPFEACSFDAVLCAVSVQYLTQPLSVFEEVYRVLKAGAPFIVTFSNRCFPTKAVNIWLSSGDDGHVELVRNYFESSAAWDSISDAATPGKHSPFQHQDPLFAVWAFKADAPSIKTNWQQNTNKF